jgi:D-alanyl-D-alanine carboxypeptidase/D-alanyl-D-alanine-endopeptidase (penicillin-binding protein 4)
MRRSTLVCTICVVVLTAATGAVTRAGNLRAVQNEIASALAHPVLRHAEVGALAVSLDRGDEIYNLAPDQPLIPASNMKIVTVATAFELLGADHDCSSVDGAGRNETLADLARRILKPSNNALADALLTALPAAAGRPLLDPEELCAEVWGERGLYLHGTRWTDGSGLNRRNMMSPEVIVGLLEAMHRSGWQPQFIAALPIAGVDGTLRDRMRAGRARGRVAAKTGTLTGVSALSGYADTVSGERIAFALVMNGFDCDVDRVRRLQDRVCETMVGLTREGVCAERPAGH